MTDFERDCAVNYLGVVRVSLAFIPQLRRSAQLVAQRAAQRWKRPTASAAAPRMLVISSMSGTPYISPCISMYLPISACISLYLGAC